MSEGLEYSVSDKSILYLPSRWSKRLPHDTIVPEHLEFVKQASETIKNCIPNQANISYGTHEREKLDIFGTDLDDGSPIFVFVHGGYWQVKSITKDSYWFIAKNLYKNKIKSIFIGYELCPDVTLTEIIKEINTALLKCLDYAKTCRTRSIYLAGHSAGGHLVATTFTSLMKELSEDSKSMIKATFLFCGVFALPPLVDTEINIPLKLDEDLAKELSPQHQDLTAMDTKFYVIAAENDCPALVEQARQFHSKLKQHNYECVLEIFNGFDHFDIIESLNKEHSRLNAIIVNEIIGGN